MKINRKIARTVMEHKSQYLGSAVLVFISCLLFSVFNIMGVNVVKNLNDFKRNNVQEDASFVLQSELTGIPALESTYGVILEERGTADFQFDNKSTLRILSKTDKIDKYAVTAGSDISGRNEVLIDPGFAKAHNIAIGSTVTLFGQGFKVTGYTSSPDYIYPLKTESDMIKNPDTFGIAIMSKADYKKLGRGYSFYSIKFKENNRDDFKKYLEQNNSIVKWVNKEDNMRISFIEGDIKGIGPMGKVLPVVILLLTCVLVSVVLWRLIKREFTEIGVLYALGYRKSEILRHYMMYAVVIAAAGSVTGTLAGALLEKPFMSFVTGFYNLPVLGIDYQVKYLIISILLPFAFLLPTTAAVVLKALALSPRELMAGGSVNTKINFLEKRLRLARFRFNTKFRIRGVVRNISRTLLMLLGVVFASGLLLLGFSMKDSMDYLLHNSYDDVYKYECSYMFNSIQTGKPEYGEAVMTAPFTSERNTVKDGTIVIYGVQRDSKLIRLKDSSGNELSFNNVIVTKTLADRLNIHKGDSFPVESRTTSKKFTLKVDKIADFRLGEFVYMPIDEFDKLCGLPDGSYIEIYSDRKLDIPTGKLISTINKEDMIQGYQAIIKPIQYMTGMIGLAAFIIGLIVIYVVTSLIIEENRKNISLMKILGYGKKELYSLVLNTNTLLVILGYVLSVPLVFYSMGLFFNVMTAEMNIDIPVKLNTINIFIGFVFIIATYEISKLLNRKKISRINMADSLKNTME